MTEQDFTPEPAWWQAFNESEATVVNQYVWGVRPGHRDELILRDRVTTPATSETSSEPPEPDERLWSLMDYYDPTSAVNTEGEVVERYRFSAFGLRAVLDADFSPRTVSHYDWDFAFKGQFLDVDTGYYNYGYRFYSPELGRWLSKDPIGERGGINLYGMADENPVNQLDFLGLVLWTHAGDQYTIALARLACSVEGCAEEGFNLKIELKGHRLFLEGKDRSDFRDEFMGCFAVVVTVTNVVTQRQTVHISNKCWRGVFLEHGQTIRTPIRAILEAAKCDNYASVSERVFEHIDGVSSQYPPIHEQDY